ncbi:DNA polymerase III subunit delta [Paraliobacillus quinghaiensis]|uniref:DNA polymerase III subunit delta n=1 Tax=Paraliobacillus quinghaiensis TaxID=470815 RepID=A0A917WTM2_9BACI|nr:DNA polymerase III subunit delta [Paraliobacillus quinghaiensis]GGM31110.1 DNA polymerase III subunit delta [Paraliobacillus quinghaiensis]
MDYFKAVEKIKKKQIEAIYVLQGQESFLIESVMQELIANGLATEDQEANIIRYDLEETPIQEVIMDVETYPFFGGKKIIFAYNPIFLTGKQDKTNISHDLESLQAYINNPVDYSMLVMIAPYEKLDERKKLVKLLKKEATIIQCEEVKAWNIDQWIDHLAKTLHVNLEKPVYELLVQETGTNLLMLEKELEKLATYVGENGTITASIAEELVAHQANTSGLKLVDAVIAKDLNKAIQIYKDLVRMNDDEIALVALLASQFRTILHVKILKQKGYSQKQMAQHLKVHPYVIKMAMVRESKFSRQRLETIINACANTDAQIKQGKVEKALAFELLLYQLIQNTSF